VIVVVGGRGLIGSSIVTRLRSSGHEVMVVTHDPKRAGDPGTRYGDLTRPDTLEPAVAGADVVIQSVNFPTYPIEKSRRRQTFVAYDGIGTERLVRAAERVGARRYVFISGVGARSGSPKPYFQALRRGERAVLDAGLEPMCIEPTMVFGPRSRGLNTILAVARWSPLMPVIGDGTEMHQPVYVEDVTELVRQAAELGAPQGVFEVGGPERFSLEELLRRLFAAAGLERRIVHVPFRLARASAALLERLPGQLLTRSAIDFFTEDFVADLGPLAASFSLRLTPFEEGLARYLSPRGARLSGPPGLSPR
jgi:uncharacterized protein YbjT (DUF2867 family)